MAFDPSYREYIEEQLSEFGAFTSKKMFGGVGFFRDQIMFGGIMNDKFRLKTNQDTIPDFKAYNAERWDPGKTMALPYYEVPHEIIEDKQELKQWANKAFVIARDAKKIK